MEGESARAGAYLGYARDLGVKARILEMLCIFALPGGHSSIG